MDKQEMRKSILRARDALNPVERERGNILLTERILGHQWFYGSEVLLCFVSIGRHRGNYAGGFPQEEKSVCAQSNIGVTGAPDEVL